MLFYAIIKIVVVFPLFYFKMFPFFFFSLSFRMNAQVTASSFDAQDALTSDPARLVVRGMMS